MTYPVLQERALPPVVKRPLRSPRRELSDLPEPVPGAVYVFHHAGRCYEIPLGTGVTGTEPHVAGATAVSLVDTRTRLLTAKLYSPSARAADDFSVQVSYRCTVSSAETVAHQGVLDLMPTLNQHLLGDPELRAITSRYPVDRIRDVREEVAARIAAYTEFRPVRVTGMRIELSAVQVLTPDELRAHSAKIRDEEWNQEYTRKTHVGIQSNVDFYEPLLTNSQSSRVVAFTRGDLSAADIAEQQMAVENAQRSALLELTKVIQQTGHLDMVSVDAQRVMSSLLDDLAPGTALPKTPQPEQLPQGEEGRFRPEEDDLV